MAVRQPDYIRLSAIERGVDRQALVGKLGKPKEVTENNDGERREVYRFRQGYHRSTKLLRAVGHIILDLHTIFLWEFIGMPIEVALNGEKMTVIAIVDSDQKIKSFEIIYDER